MFMYESLEVCTSVAFLFGQTGVVMGLQVLLCQCSKPILGVRRGK